MIDNTIQNSKHQKFTSTSTLPQRPYLPDYKEDHIKALIAYMYERSN